jgi:hypothetical protein
MCSLIQYIKIIWYYIWEITIEKNNSNWSYFLITSDLFSMCHHLRIHSLVGYICRPVSVSQTMMCDGSSFFPMYHSSTNTWSPLNATTSFPSGVFHIKSLFICQFLQVFFHGIGWSFVSIFLSLPSIPSSCAGFVHQSHQMMTCHHVSSVSRRWVRCVASVWSIGRVNSFHASVLRVGRYLPSSWWKFFSIAVSYIPYPVFLLWLPSISPTNSLSGSHHIPVVLSYGLL